LIGAFILSVNDDIVFNIDDTEAALSWCLVDNQIWSSPHVINITFTHDWSIIHNDLDPKVSVPPPIQMDQICHVSKVFKTGEEIKYQSHLDAEWYKYFKELTNGSSQNDCTLIQYLADPLNVEGPMETIRKTSITQFTQCQ
jgi:hypothetical protein